MMKLPLSLQTPFRPPHIFTATYSNKGRVYPSRHGVKRTFSAILLILVLTMLTPLTPRVAVAAHDHLGRIDLRGQGALGDGKADDTEHFNTALRSIGESAATIVISQGVFRVESLVIPPNVTLAFTNGGTIAVAADHELEINGNIDGGMTRLFAGAGTVSGKPQTLHVYPQWFGASGDGIADDSRALQQAAHLAATAMGKTLFIPEGDYLFREDISLRCNVESRGLFIIEHEIDEDRTQFCNDLFLPTHHPKHAPVVRFEPDHPEQELSSDLFLGIAEGALVVPVFQQVPLADGSGHIDLEEGGVLRFYSSDFFSSRNVRKGAHYYDKNDICQMVSGRGDVFPEFAFAYSAPPDAAPWREDAVYDKGDYCTFDGEIFKATWASGAGASFRHRHLGAVSIGAVQPDPASPSTVHAYTYDDGTPDSILLWRRVRTQVWYRSKDTPVTVNGLRIEVRLKNHGGETKRIAAGAVTVSRSNMTFNSMEISVRDREATLSRLLQSSSCVNIEFNNGYFSGATSAHLGYNILNSNVANFRYNHCISTNSRKGMDGRHGKNIHVIGGYYNVIDNHYGRNYTIRDVVFSGQSVRIPKDSTPEADLQAWEFSSRTALSFNGANFYIQNITVDGAAGVLGARSDIGDLYGDIVLKDVSIRNNTGDVQLFRHWIHPTFDYAHDVKTPSRLVIENVSLENPGGIGLTLGSGFGDRPYGPVFIRQAEVSSVYSASPDTHFTSCQFKGARFDVTDAARIHFHQCVFSGENKGLTETNMGVAAGNVAVTDATLSFPLDYVNQETYITH